MKTKDKDVKFFGIIILIIGIILSLGLTYILSIRTKYITFFGIDDLTLLSATSLVMLLIGFILIYFSKSKSLGE